MKRWTRRLGVFAAIAVVAASAVGCGEIPTCREVESEEAAGSAAPISVTLKDFSITPMELTAPASRTLTFDVSNEGSSPHTSPWSPATGRRTRARSRLVPARPYGCRRYRREPTRCFAPYRAIRISECEDRSGSASRTMPPSTSWRGWT